MSQLMKLAVNPQVLAMAKAGLRYTQEELDYFTSALLQSNTDTSLYTSTPPADASVEAVTAAAADKNGDWSRIVHPHVLSQLIADMVETMQVPCPDNVYVFVNNDWMAQSFVLATPPAAPAPAPAPAAPPAPPAAAQVTRPVMGAQVTMDAGTAQQVDAARAANNVVTMQPHDPLENLQHDVQYPSTPTLQQPPLENQIEDGDFTPAAPVATPAPAPTPAQAAATLATGTQYGLPDPTTVGGPLAKDPGGEIPKGAPARHLRDMLDMFPHLFSAPAPDVIGKGKGATQRTRVYLAGLAVLDLALSSVGDEACTVGYLRHHIAHLRYNAYNTPAGATMAEFEKYLFQTGEK